MRWGEYKFPGFTLESSTPDIRGRQQLIKRNIEVFLFIPKTINGFTRWLEIAQIAQEGYLWDGKFTGHWFNVNWIN